MNRFRRIPHSVTFLVWIFGLRQTSHTAEIAATSYESIQAAVDANPGRMVLIPPGDYEIKEPIRLKGSGGGLQGFGRIVQTNPEAEIIFINQASDTRIRDVTLARPAERAETDRHAISAIQSDGIEISGIRVIDNRSSAGTIYFEKCRRSRIQNCTVKNYKRIAIDDRTGSELYGYAFRVIDGTGILVTESDGILIEGNSVIEANIIPNAQTKQKYKLGELTDGRQPLKKGKLAPPANYANNWHQGSAIVVTAPEVTDNIQILGNSIESAAQGIDIHADHVICSNNTINVACIGIKCMHGSRNVIISGNNISRFDYWGLIMMPGTSSHPAEAATEGKSATGANLTSGNVIANNVFSDFGLGHEYFNWEKSKIGIISLESGQLTENPVMTDVLIQGNIVYDSAKDEVPSGETRPRYPWAVFISPNPRPQRLRFIGNIFEPGSQGISNVELN